MSQWVDRLSETGRSEYLFELEMWLRSFERYFRIRNQPLSEDSTRTLAIRSFYEEIGLVAHAIERVTKLCTLLSSEDQVSHDRFDKYVENFLKRDDIADPYVARLLRQASPASALTLLRESFEDLKLLLTELSKLSRIPYSTFQSVGRLIYREVRRNEYLALLMDKKFKPASDRITVEAIAELIHAIEDRDRRRLVANMFLQFFRLLHYLEYADPRKRHLEELRTSVLIFSLVASETRSLVDYIQKEQSRLGPNSGFPETFESFVYCVPLELRKVINTELTELTSYKQADTVYMRLENSHGILRDCFQQAIIQLAQGFDPDIDGQSIFSHYETHFEQSQMLRRDLVAVLGREDRGTCGDDEAAHLPVLRSLAALSHVPRLVELRVVRHGDSEVRQRAGSPPDSPPVRHLSEDASSRSEQAGGSPGALAGGADGRGERRGRRTGA
jgi:hypothetical protein